MSDRASALAYLLARINYERDLAPPYGAGELKLDRMRDLLARLGNPQQRLEVIHLAGTKGKGSTAAMVAAILSAAGLRTGLFTSPHLENLEERFVVDGAPCLAADVVALVEQLRPIVADMDRQVQAAGDADCGPTYFELTTAMALLHFVRRGARAAVLEVGMGGRLDATNVCHPRVTAITSISYDHTRQLGNTLAAIAGEKAGIAKPGVPMVSGVTDAEPRAVIERVCRERGSPLVQAGVDFDFSYRPPRQVDVSAAAGQLDFRSHSRGSEVHAVDVALLGRHQAANAAVALAVVEELRAAGWPISDAAARQGLAEVRCPARIEIAGREPLVILDGAHNVASVQALLDTLAESFAPRPRLLVFATTREKDVQGMLALLVPRFDHVILTRYRNNPRGVPIEELLPIASGLSRGAIHTAPDTAEAWKCVRALATPRHLVCVTGSFFIAAEMRQAMVQ